MIEQIQEDQKVTVKYRDKMLIERNNILNNYAKQTSDKGTMYYIYDKNSTKDNTYNLCICDEDKIHQINELNEKDFSEGARIDSVLRRTNSIFKE